MKKTKKELQSELEFARAEGFFSGANRLDLLIALLISLIVFYVMSRWAYPALHPDYWSSAAVVAGTRPPELPVIGMWTFLARGICRFVGLEQGLSLLALLGRAMGGFLAGVAYLLIRMTFSTKFALLPNELGKITYRLRWLTAAGALIFAFSDPVWRLTQFFSADLLHVTLAAFSAVSFWLFWRTGRFSMYCVSFMLAGVLAAESPVGLVFALMFFILKEIAQIRANALPQMGRGFAVEPSASDLDADPGDVDEEVASEKKLTASSLENWAFCVFFFAAFIGTLLLDGWLFRMMGGMEVKHLAAWDYPMILASSWIGCVRNVISMDDFLAAASFSIVPFLLVRSLMGLATDAKSRLAFPLGCLIAAMGLAAYTQLGPWARLWYWSWDVWRASVPSNLVQVVLAFFGAGALAAAAQVVCCGCRRRYLGVDTIAVAESKVHVLLRTLGSIMLAVFTLFLVAASAYGRLQPNVRARILLVERFAQAVVENVKTSTWVFTDGSLDDRLRVLFRLGKIDTQPVSVLSGHLPYETYLRSIAAKDVEDRPALEAGGAEAFRFWVGEKPAHLAASATMVGFEVLKKCRSKRPRTAGLAMRVAKNAADEASFDQLNEAAVKFSEEALKVVAQPPGSMGGFDRSVNEKIDFMLWRLARMQDERAAELSRRQIEADKARDLARRLDDANRSLKVLTSKLERLKPAEGVVLTPREGLDVCLKRADFDLARHYAQMVLRVDGDDSAANFALGMWELENEEYQSAMRHLQLSLKRRPKDFAALNNLSLAQLKLGLLREALESVETAAKLYPDSPQVMRNLARIRAAVQEAGKAK